MKNQNLATKLIIKSALAALSLFFLETNAAHAVTNHWSGAAADQNWLTPGNWDNGAAPVVTDDVLFDSVDGQPDFKTNDSTFSTNNILNQSLTIRSLTYSNWTYTASYPNYLSQHTEIGNGVTLTVTNGMIVGVSSGNAKGFTTTPRTFATISGLGGSLNITGGNVAVGNQSSESTTVFTSALLDMDNLGNFSYVSTNGTFGIASAVHRRQGGEVFLARTNLISGSALSVGIGATGVGTHAGLLHLGQTNALNADTVTIGKDSEGHVDFSPGLTNTVVRIRGKDGVHGVGTMYMGWTTSTGSSWGFGTNDFTPGVIDAVVTNLTISLHAGEARGLTNATVDSLLIGPSPSNSFVVQNSLTIGSAPGTTNVHTSYGFGTLDMQGGTFTAGPVVLGSARLSCTGTGTINIHGGTFAAQSITFATVITPQTVGTAYGNLNLDGGSASITGDLSAGAGTSTCAVTNAILNVGGTIGQSTNGLSSLTLNDATLQLTLAGGTNIGAYVEALDLEGTNTIVITNQNLVTGQFPIIAYASVGGSGGVAGLVLNVPAGVTASLVDNSTNQTVDLLVTDVVLPAAQPAAGPVTLTGNTLSITGTGTANQPYKLYATTNITLPVNQWILLQTTNATSGGLIQFFDQATNVQRFYELSR